MSKYEVPEELKDPNVRIRVQHIFNNKVDRTHDTSRSTAPGRARNYFEFLTILEKALDDYQTRTPIVPTDRKLKMSWERVDDLSTTEIVTVSVVRREPGAYSQGAPFEGSIKNYRPILREHREDPNNPGYRVAVLGKWFDNAVRFTCWAQTNKEAIQRSFWFEEFMEKYSWFFVASGVPRVLFMEHEEQVIDNDGNKIYGRSLVYYVKTEEITLISEKELEEIVVSLSVEEP
jgi:hypothetical protein